MSEDQRRELEERLRSMSPEELREYQKRQCIFCRIVSGEIPAKKVYEDDKVFAILDINPAAAGHLLLLPKEHFMVLQQMPDDDVGHLFLIAKSFSQAFLQALRAEGTTFFCASGQAAGQRAQHVMIHLIPRKDGDGIGIKPKPLPVRPQDLEMVAKAMKPFVDKVMGVSASKPAKQPGESKPQISLSSPIPSSPTPSSSAASSPATSLSTSSMSTSSLSRSMPLVKKESASQAKQGVIGQEEGDEREEDQVDYGEQDQGDDRKEDQSEIESNKEGSDQEEHEEHAKEGKPRSGSSLDDIADFLAKK